MIVLRASLTPGVGCRGVKVGPGHATGSARSARAPKSLRLWLGVPLWTHFIGRASANSQRFHHQASLKALHLRGVLDAHRGLFALLGRIERRAPLAARSGERRLLHRPRRVLALAFFLGARFDKRRDVTSLIFAWQVIFGVRWRDEVATKRGPLRSFGQFTVREVVYGS